MITTRARLASLFGCIAAVVLLGVVVAPVPPAAAFAQERRLESISCVSKSLCRATINSGVVEKWNGRKWRPGFRLPSDTRTFFSISCPTKDFCAAMQAIKIPGQRTLDYRPVTRNADGTWDYSVAPIRLADSPVFFHGLSCTSASFCMLTDSQGNYRRWNGTLWTAPVKFQNESSETAISCASPTMCKATDDLTEKDAHRPVWSWNGSSWSVHRSGSSFEHGMELSCATVSFCMLTHGLHYNILSGSHISSDKRLPNRIYSVSCTSASFCIGVNGDALGSFLWNGKRWSGPHKFTGQKYLTASCSSPSFCGAVSYEQDSLFRVNGTWQAPQRVE